MVTLNINGRDHQVDVDPSTPILWALRDNLDMTRLADPTQSDLQRSQKYVEALRVLGMSPE